MLKTISKFVLVAAVAAMAVSFSTPSYAAKKKKMAAAPTACTAWQYKTAQCNNLGWCSMQRCGLDGKWYPSLMACWQPSCPK
jgi:predicted RNA-binding Zn ribbon-like protein